MYASTKRLHNTPQHIHYDVNFPENFNAQAWASAGGEKRAFAPPPGNWN